MKYYLLLILFVLYIHCLGQDSSFVKSERMSVGEVTSALSVHYGHFIYPKNRIFETQNITNSLEFISVGLLYDNMMGAYYSFYGYSLATVFLPKNIVINDSNSFRLRGYYFSQSFAGQPIILRKHFELRLTEGLSFGRLKIRSQENKYLKNPIFAPFIGIILKIKIGNLGIFFFSNADFDISSSKWKKNIFRNQIENAVDNFNHSGFSFRVGLNYGI